MQENYMKRFDYSFLKNYELPSEFTTYSGALGELKAHAEWQKLQYPDVFTKMHEIAIVQSIKGSNAIEGIVASDERIKAIVNKGSEPLNHDEREIAGYKLALNEVHTRTSELDFRINDIKDLHGLMVSLTNKRGGEFKESDNAIVEQYSDGTRKIRWETTSAKDTPFAMEQLYLAYIDARNDYSINSILLIPCVILDFLCIHPFSDGNGRMSRLLTLLLLYKSGYDVGRYISFEEQINQNKGEYYEALKASSTGWHENRNSYLPFMRNFLSTLFMCYKELDKRFITIDTQKAKKQERITAAVMSSFIPLSKADIASLVPDASVVTIEAVLGKLVKEGKIQKIGSGHATKYIKSR